MTTPSQPTSTRVDVTIPSNPASIAPVRRAVEDLAAEIGLSEAAVGDVGLCVNEALANVIRHAYGGAGGRPIAVRAWCEDDGIVVTIRDWGNGVNPASLPPKAYDPCEPGGLGLICLQRMMTRVSYVPQGDGMLLVMARQKQDSARRPKCGGVGNDDCCGGPRQGPTDRSAANE